MDKPWIDEVRKTGQLSVYPGAGATGGPWATVFKDAIREFNTFAHSKNFGVTLTVGTAPPDPKGPQGANILLDVTDAKTVSYTANGQLYTKTLPFAAAASPVHGITSTLSYEHSHQIFRAFIFLPKTPQVGDPGNRTQREAGSPVKLVIAVHEFIHACGLEKHSTQEASADVLFSPVVAERGNKPSDDRIKIPIGNGRLMPPLYLSDETARRIKSLWVPSQDIPEKQLMRPKIHPSHAKRQVSDGT
jgi:hypothetical protein